MIDQAKKKSTPTKKSSALLKTSAALNIPASVTEAELKKRTKAPRKLSKKQRPKNVRELMALAYGEKLEDMGENPSFGNFSYDVNHDEHYQDRPEIADSSINAEHHRGLEFLNGNYQLSDPAILIGAEAYGKEVLQAAAMFSVKITDLEEFKDIDYNGDGHIDAREVGVTILAASLESRLTEFATNNVSRKAGTNDLISVFTNHVSAKDLESLLDPKRAHLAKEIARQFLIDNGLMPDNNDNSDKANIAFMKSVKKSVSDKK